MKKFLRNNNNIEAIQYNGKNAEEIKKWAGETYIIEKSINLKSGEKYLDYLNLITPSGLNVVFLGDYIIKEGEIFYHLNEAIFNSLFKEK